MIKPTTKKSYLGLLTFLYVFGYIYIYVLLHTHIYIIYLNTYKRQTTCYEVMIPRWDAPLLLMIKPTTKSIPGKRLCFVWKKIYYMYFITHSYNIFSNKTQTRTHIHTHIYIGGGHNAAIYIYMSDMGEITIIIYWRWSHNSIES